MSALKASDLLTFSWSFASSRVVEYYRQYFGEVTMVDTKIGPVKGHKITSSFDFTYFNFHGIPYAKPPVGDLRFKDPQPFEPSDRVINAEFLRGNTQACQKDLMTHKVSGAENCLHLSIYSRDIKPEKLKPVMLWIHGGAFLFGSNTKDFYNPEYLLRNDVVVVAINYRLGAFGFLNFDDPEVGIPGNAGLKDQCMAMKWVKENCSAFGGDPDNITIFGESAGGAAVGFHLVSEMSKGLFHKAILMSGTVYSSWALTPVKDWTKRLARKLGWDGEGDDKTCFKVIQKASPDSIVKATDDILTLEDRKQFILFAFGPTIESYKSDQCFMANDPKILIRSAWSTGVPVIVGGCSNEGLLFNKMYMKKSTLEKIDLANAVPFHELSLDPAASECQEIGEMIKKFYFGFLPISEETLNVFLMLLGDKLFIHSIHRMILNRQSTKLAPTYLYRFAFDSPMSLTKKLFASKNARGACHGDDLSFLFKTAFASVPRRDSKEWKVIEGFTGSWTSFAHTGNPNSETFDATWEPTEIANDSDGKPNYKVFDIDAEPAFVDSPDLERMHFWDQMFNHFKHELF